MFSRLVNTIVCDPGGEIFFEGLYKFRLLPVEGDDPRVRLKPREDEINNFPADSSRLGFFSCFDQPLLEPGEVCLSRARWDRNKYKNQQ